MSNINECNKESNEEDKYDPTFTHLRRWGSRSHVTIMSMAL